MFRFRFLTILAALLLLAAPLAADARPVDIDAASNYIADDPLARELDAYFSASYAADEPGAAVLVRRGDQVLLRKGYGMADLEQNLPMTPDRVFRIGSITKQFTAVAILLLEQDGKLDLKAPITRYLPGYPAETGDTITVEHLLHHTSGVPSYTDEPGWLDKVIQDMTPDEMIARWQDKPLEFEPGARWKYSNSGYFMLGAIVEKVSGMSYEDFVERRIFQPLGMTSSDYGAHARIIPRRARGYHRGEDGYVNAPYLSMTQPYAAGSLLSTVDDLARWDAALREAEILPKEALEHAWTTAHLNDGKATAYGYGWGLSEIAGHRVVHHGGGIHGFATMTIHLPEEKIFVAVLSNNPQHQPSPSDLAQAATSALLGEPWKLEPVAIDPAKLADYVGVYRINEDETRVVTVEDGALHTQRSGSARLVAAPVGEDAFGYESNLSRFHFERGADGAVTHMVMVAWGAEPERAERTDEAIPEGPKTAAVDPAIYDTYAGNYELVPGFVLNVRREGDQLITQATGQGPIEIFPESETVFFNQAIGAKLTFVRGDDGSVGMVVLEQGGQRIEGKRVEGE